MTAWRAKEKFLFSLLRWLCYAVLCWAVRGGRCVQVIGPDEKGIKIVIEWRVNEMGQRIKTTKKIRVRKQLKKLKPEVIRRRGLSKFGDAKGQLGSENFTMVSTEEIFLERPNMPGAKQEEAKPSGDLAAIGSASLMVCRICGKKGDHWTSKCPFKELAAAKGLSIGEKLDDEPSALGGGGAGGKASYVPPSLRAGGAASRGETDGGGRGGRGGRDDNSIRVTNLSEDTREQDLQELFAPFGPISRIYVAFDRETGLSRGFAFINFVNRWVLGLGSPLLGLGSCLGSWFSGSCFRGLGSWVLSFAS